MSVQEYLDKHMLSRKIEDAVNAAVRAKTPDPILFIVTLSLSLRAKFRFASLFVLMMIVFFKNQKSKMNCSLII